MRKYIFLIALLCFPVISTYAITEFMRKFITRTFGIDASDKTLNNEFIPTLKNLNTLTIHPCAQDPGEALSVAEVAYQIHHDTLIFPAHVAVKTVESRAYNHWRIEHGVQPNDTTTFVVVRGYAGADEPALPTSPEPNKGMCAVPRNGGGMITAYQWLKNGIINGATIIFDYPDTRGYFDFGLKNDQTCLDFLHTHICAANTKPVYLSNCRGSKSVLNFLAKSRPSDVAAVVLDAPFMDLTTFTDEIGKSYGRYVPFSNRIARTVITKWHASYNPEDELTFADLHAIPQEIPIFIGHLKNDCLVPDNQIRTMVNELVSSGHTVYLLVIDDASKSHSRLYQTEPFKLAVNAFFKRYGLPHNAELAHEGRFLLNYAAYNTKHPNNWYIYKVK